MIGGGFSLESSTKFFDKLSILKLNDLFNIKVAKIIYAYFINNLPSKLFKFFSQTKTSHVPPEQLNRHAISYTFPDIQLSDFNDALIIKKLKFGIISHLKFKIPQQGCSS